MKFTNGIIDLGCFWCTNFRTFGFQTPPPRFSKTLLGGGGIRGIKSIGLGHISWKYSGGGGGGACEEDPAPHQSPHLFWQGRGGGGALCLCGTCRPSPGDGWAVIPGGLGGCPREEALPISWPLPLRRRRMRANERPCPPTPCTAHRPSHTPPLTTHLLPRPPAQTARGAGAVPLTFDALAF